MNRKVVLVCAGAALALLVGTLTLELSLRARRRARALAEWGPPAETKVWVRELAGAFSADAAAAHRKYFRKFIEVEGRVTRVGAGDRGEVIVSLSDRYDPARPEGMVVCAVPPARGGPALDVDCPVTVRGTCVGVLPDGKVGLAGCYLVGWSAGRRELARSPGGTASPH